MIATAITALVGAIVSLALTLAWRAAAARVENLSAQYEYTRTALNGVRLGKDDVEDRLNRVIDGLRAEIRTLEVDLEACRDPGTVRSRLQRVLEEGTHPASGAGGSTPATAETARTAAQGAVPGDAAASG